jgi:hypothetical protein
MTIKNFSFTTMMFAGVIALAGCPGDDTAETNGETDDPTTGSPTTTPSTSAPTTTTASTSGMTESMTGETDTTGPGETDTDTSTSTGPDPTIFEFRDDPPEDYTQIDRMGLPAVNTALIATDNKDAYNADDPTARAGGAYDDDIRDSITTLHVGVPGMQTPANTGLNDDMMALGLFPCTHTIAGGETCLDQLGPLIVAGDQIAVDTTAPAGFPNGRQPANAVIDVVLGVLLLQVGMVPGGGMQTGLEFAALPLNPDANDVAFPAAFPYFAPAQ